MVTASQLNRSAVDEAEFDHSHISGGISKINTADNVFGIFTSRRMKEAGKYEIQCMKSRSSTGVGQKVELDYGIENMRITDPGIPENSDGGPPRVASIMNQIKQRPATQAPDDGDENPTVSRFQRATGTPAWEQPAKKVTADVQSTKLKQMIAGFKKSD
jgi:hypothetical protein